MTDFVARLEEELHRAAVRQEQSGRLWRRDLPRVRLALPSFAVAAMALAGLALAIAAIAVFVGSDSTRISRGGVPAELRGTWRLAAPVEFHVEPLTVDLQLHAAGSARCTALGVETEPCYEIENAEFGALEWGALSIAGDQITFRAKLLTYCQALPCPALGPEAGRPGVYRWRVAEGSLRLTMRSDELTARATALGAGPLTRPAGEAHRAKIPEGWTARRFASHRYGYSIGYPRQWRALPAALPMPSEALITEVSDTVDRFSQDPRGIGLPLLAIGATEVSRQTRTDLWTAQVAAHIERSQGCFPSDRRSATVGGAPATITVYTACHRRHTILATFVHDRRAYQATWFGKPGRAKADAPLFHGLLQSFEFGG
jgi:hypothetical protein